MDALEFAKMLLYYARVQVDNSIDQIANSDKGVLFDGMEWDVLAGKLETHLCYCLYDLMDWHKGENEYYRDIFGQYTVLLSADMIALTMEEEEIPEDATGVHFEMDLFPQYQGKSYRHSGDQFDGEQSPDAVLIRSLADSSNAHLPDEAYALAASVGQRLFIVVAKNFFHDAEPVKLELDDLLS